MVSASLEPAAPGASKTYEKRWIDDPCYLPPSMATRELDGKQRRYLRALGHHIKPVVQVGTDGATTGVTQALDPALTRHELVKVRVLAKGAEDLDELATNLASETSSAHAQTLGRTLLFYRPHPKKPRITLPTSAPAKKAKRGAA
jgi:RNA-binding protein